MLHAAGINPQLYHYNFPSISVFTSYSPSRSFLIKNSPRCFDSRSSSRKKKGSVHASSSRRCNEIIHGGRRALFFAGLSTLPYFHLSAGALDSFPPSVSEDNALGKTENTLTKEIENEGSASQNIFLSILNEVGVLGIGVLGSLYALAQKDKETTKTIIDSLNSEILTKEGLTVSLKKEMESKLVKEQEKWANLLQKSKEEQQNLVNQLSSAKSNINALGNDLKNGMVAMEGLKGQVSALNFNLTKSREVKDSLETQLKESLKSVETLQDKVILLEAELQVKEEDIRNLRRSAGETSVQMNEMNEKHDETRDELEKAIVVIETLKGDLLESSKGLESSQALVESQKLALVNLENEKAEIHERLTALQDDHYDLKSSSKTKAASDAEQLKKSEEELSFVEEKMRLAVIKLDEEQATVRNLTEEIIHCKKLLELEVVNVRKLRGELQTAQEALAKETFEMKNQMKKINSEYSSLEKEIGSLKSQLSDSTERINFYDNEMKTRDALADELKLVQEQLQKAAADLQSTKQSFAKESSKMETQLKETNTKCSSLEKAKAALESKLSESEERIIFFKNEIKIKDALSNEVNSMREQLQKTSDDLKTITQKLKLSTKENEDLRKEHEAATKRAESLSNDLEAERAKAEEMSKKVKKLEEGENEAKMKLERDLREALKSLEEMNRNAEALTKEAEKANSQVLGLEGENEVLLKSLTEQKNASMETVGSLEDAHNMILRLGKERESLQAKASLLEDELASAKGEILRLRSQRNSLNGSVDASNDVTSSPKKIVKKKKV